jgi:ferredoxin
MVPVIDKESCTGCGSCIDICPNQAIYMEGEKAQIDAEFCEECGFCTSECPVDSIKIMFPIFSGSNP